MEVVNRVSEIREPVTVKAAGEVGLLIDVLWNYFMWCGLSFTF